MPHLSFDSKSAFLLLASAGIFFSFGLLFSSTPATGYPSSAINLGNNPVVSEGGAFSDDGTVDLFTSYTGSDIVVTDIVFSMSIDNTNSCVSSFVGSFMLSSGGKLAELAVGMSNPTWGAGTQSPLAAVQLSSGVRIPAGDTLTLHMNRRYLTGCGDAQVHYIVSGYRASP